MTGREIPAALRRCLSSIPEFLVQVDVENQATGRVEIVVILERFGGRKQDAVVTVFAQQPPYPLQRSGVIIDDKDDIPISQDRYPWSVHRALTVLPGDDLKPVSVRRS